MADYEPMRIECQVAPVAAVIAIVVPTVMYVLAAIYSVNKLLKSRKHCSDQRNHSSLPTENTQTE